MAVVALMVLLPAIPIEAQTWSSAQQEVWNTVSGNMEAWYSGDVETAQASVHPELIWWNTANDVPGDYETAREADAAFWTRARTRLSSSCTPLTIQAFDEFAMVNMYCRGFIEAPAGQDPEFFTERWHVVLKKEGDRWLEISNYGDLIPR